ncbi:MAG: hypothetical protein IE916_08045 [Epsilonproteobacteria bacterium]|nr:hypothetical protein [Campylobacterota bacterium]
MQKTTLIRRIERRLAALKIDTLSDYVDFLKSNIDEVDALYHDILIGVTEFFRDKDVYEKIESHIQGILAKKEQGKEIRFWVVGCSTGEEAYSLAIMLCEILKEKVNKYKIKIFATDIDDESLKIARTGIYAETSLVNMKSCEYEKRVYSAILYDFKKSIRGEKIDSRACHLL